jgi:hypothetical protein
MAHRSARAEYRDSTDALSGAHAFLAPKRIHEDEIPPSISHAVGNFQTFGM